VQLPRTGHPPHSTLADVDGSCTNAGVQSDPVSDRLLQRCASTALQPIPSGSCSMCRTTQLGSSSMAPKRSHATPLLNTLHWLPVQQRTNYKVALPTFKVRSTSTPSYLHRLLQDLGDVHNLRRRSATQALYLPFTKTTIAKRAFCCSAQHQPSGTRYQRQFLTVSL